MIEENKKKKEAEALRKEEDEIDLVNSKLRGWSDTLSEKIQKEDEERLVKEREQKRIEEEQMIEENKKKKEAEALRKEELKKKRLESKEDEDEEESSESLLDWSLLKLHPKFEVSETHSAYVIHSYIPGLNEEEINIKLGKNKKTITVEGTREPTEEELKQLKLAILRKYRGYNIDETSLNQLLLKAGSGRYGKFSETYQLPDSVAVDNINAHYERGMLKVTIPKIERFNRHPAHIGQRKNPYNSRGFPNSFFNDGDLFW